MTLVTDNMAGYLMQQGRIDVIVVGADRIAANGDTANKIGTYTLAVLAGAPPHPVLRGRAALDHRYRHRRWQRHSDRRRDAAEVTGFRGVRWAPEGVSVANPAFDVTPAGLITGLVTEKGVISRPDTGKIRSLFGS